MITWKSDERPISWLSRKRMLIMCIGCCHISQDVSRKGCTLQELSDLRLKTESNRVLVFSGYHNKITETGWLKQHEWIFSHFWRLEGLDRGAAGLVSGEYSFPDFQTDAFLLCPDKVFLQIMCIEIFLFFFLYGHQPYYTRTLHLRHHFTLITF